jgi:hypothetical protein
MNKPLPDWLRTTFLVHWIISALLGAGLLLIPGRVLAVIGWVPKEVSLPGGSAIPGTIFVDPMLARLLGAALLAFAWSSFQAWRAQDSSSVKLVVQTEAVYCVLGVIAAAAGVVLLDRTVPVVGYLVIVILALFAVAWVMALRRA